jgi:DNA-binding protein HU-beta
LIALDYAGRRVLLHACFPTRKINGAERRISLNKGDLVGRIAKEACLTRAQAESAFNSVIGSVTSSLKKGQKVTIVGFGAFSVAKRKARMGRNPQTGAPIKIAARKIAKFVSGSELKKAVK